MEGPQDFIAAHRELLAARRAVIVTSLAGCALLECPVPEGAFYVYPSVAAALGCVTPGGTVLGSDVDVAEYLIASAGVASVPGTAFGSPGHLRLCLARPEAVLREAAGNIARALADLRSG
jgi:aspartate aminotransferase